MVTAAEPGPAPARARPAVGGAAPGVPTAPGPEVPTAPESAAAPPDLRDRRWDVRAADRTAATAAVLLGLVTAVCAAQWYDRGGAGAALLVLASVTGATGAVLGAFAGGTRAAELRRLGLVLLVLAGVWGGCGAWVATGSPAVRLAVLAAAVAVPLVLAGVSTEMGRSGFLGAAAVVATAVLWELGLLVTDGRGAGIVLGALSVLVLGFIPRLALLTAGLTRLDDRHSRGASVSGHRVDTALAVNHRALAPVTCTVAASAVAGGWLVLGTLSPWSVALGLLLILLLCLRARAYPLTTEVVVLLAGAAVLAVRLCVQWAAENPAGPLLTLAALTTAALAALVVRPPAAVRERLRQLMNLVESLSVVLLAPVAVGAFGVYGALLDAF